MKTYSRIILLTLLLFSIPAMGKEMVDSVVVFKSDNVMLLFSKGIVVKSYKISLGYNPEGDKKKKGDFKTPEGKYYLGHKNANSRFYKSIHISYPNEKDKAEAKKNGWNPGGNIVIHGQPTYDNKKRSGNWTHGCIAIQDKEMDEIWHIIPNNTPITIYP